MNDGRWKGPGMRVITRLAAAAVVAAAMLAAGCADDCDRLCQRNAECFQDTKPLDDCTADCRVRIGQNETEAEQVRDCRACMEEASCSEVVDTCLGSCT